MNVADFCFEQSRAYGPDVDITIAGQAGIWRLKAQQNFAFLKAGQQTHSFTYDEWYTDVEGGALTKVRAQEGAYGNSHGQIEFDILERKKGTDGRAVPSN